MQDTTYLLGQAINEATQGHFEQAEQHCHHILKDSPQDSEALHLLGVLKAQQGQPELGITYIEQAIAIESKTQYLSNLANIYYVLKNFEKAICFYEKSIKQDYTNGAAYVYLGQIMKIMERPDEARAYEALAQKIQEKRSGSY